MNSGKIFENSFRDSIPENIYFYRLRDPANSFGGDGANLRFTLKNDYDCFLFKEPNFFPCELKSNQGTSFSIQHTKEEKGKDIKLSQINGLTKAGVHPGVLAGLILNFRKTQNTYWLDIRKFNEFNAGTEKKSINENDVIEYSGVKIRSELKKIKYKYFVGEFIENIQTILK